VRVWDVMTGREVRPLLIRTNPTNRAEGQVFSLTLAQDGKRLASVSMSPEENPDRTFRNTFLIWDWTNGQQLFKREEPPAQQVRFYYFSPDLRTMACSTHNLLRLHSVATGRELATLTTSARIEFFREAVFSPDGRLLGAVSYHGNPLKRDRETDQCS